MNTTLSVSAVHALYTSVMTYLYSLQCCLVGYNKIKYITCMVSSTLPHHCMFKLNGRYHEMFVHVTSLTSVDETF